MDKQSLHKSWILSEVMERVIGSKEQISARRRETILDDCINVCSDKYSFTTGSRGEGFLMKGSDIDVMTVLKDAIVLDSILDPYEPLNTTLLYARKADLRPGYVSLQLRSPESHLHDALLSACVPVGNTILISSDIYREWWDDGFSKESWLSCASKGPCISLTYKETGMKYDYAFSIFCPSWPHEASEWVSRNRLYGWPTRNMINKIIQEGCHIVSIGDKTSNDTFLQWKISFATAERRLVYSLTHLQFKVYGMLKCLLKQIESIIQAKTGEEDILCSYFLKTVIFYAVENSPSSLWQEKYTFVCFMYCLNLIIDWVNSAYCPNYFIPTHNMFLRKVHGESRKKLLDILVDLRDKKWGCLAVGTFFDTSVGELLQSADELGPHAQAILFSRRSGELECLSDMEIYPDLFYYAFEGKDGIHSRGLNKVGNLLCQSESDTDETVCYCKFVSILAAIAKTVFCERLGSTNNKQKYIVLKKCKRLLTPIASMCKSPGQLLLATFFYTTGNYTQVLVMCTKMASSFKLLTHGRMSLEEEIIYEDKFCGFGYSLLHKCKESCVSEVFFHRRYLKFYPSQFHPDISQIPAGISLPPLPYAIFLTCLCYYDLGEPRKCHEALERLQAVCVYDERQGGEKYWIVYNLLAICYQLIGDNKMAIWACRESLRVMPEPGNFSWERIKQLQSE